MKIRGATCDFISMKAPDTCHLPLLAFWERKSTSSWASSNQTGCNRSAVGHVLDGNVESAGQAFTLWHINNQPYLKNERALIRKETS